jgi:iron complex transport system substrate-binding protein
VASFDPDLVLVARDRDDFVAALTTVGIPALVLPTATSLDDVYAQIETVGSVTGHPEAATALTADMRTEIAEQLGRVPEFAVAPTFFYEVSSDYHSNTSDTFVGSIFNVLGMANIADGVDPAAGAYPQLNAEYVLDSNPTWLFIAHSDGSIPTLDEIAARPGWSELDAVAEGRVVLLDVDVASRWGPRVVELVTSIVDSLVGTSS